MVRMKSVIDIHFDLIGKSVVTENSKRLGKIADYAVDESSYYIQKLYVNPSLLKGITNEQFIIDRSQIVEITNKKIIIQDPTIKSRSGVAMPAEA